MSMNTRGVSEAMVNATVRMLRHLAKFARAYAAAEDALEAIALADKLEAALSATEPAAQGEAQRSSHRVFRREDWLPCYCAAQADHPIGAEKAAQPAERVPYCDAIGEAGEKYHAQFKHAHPLPATWRWEDLWNALLAASPAAPADGGGKEVSRSPFCGLCGEVFAYDSLGNRHCACTTGAAR